MKQQQVNEKNQKVQQKTTQRPVRSQVLDAVSENPFLKVRGIIGNHGVLSRFRSDVLQAKLTISEPNDKYAQEANRGAHAVTQKVEPFDPIKKPDKTTKMPRTLRSGIESLSGMDLNAVHVHFNSLKPVQLNALAYTKGTDIYLGPGQNRHLPHEAWHVVQQMQGRVNPMSHIKGMSINDDPALEKEADEMSKRALRKISQPKMISSEDSLTGKIHRGIDITQMYLAENDPAALRDSNLDVLNLLSIYILDYDESITVNIGGEHLRFTVDWVESATGTAHLRGEIRYRIAQEIERGRDAPVDRFVQTIESGGMYGDRDRMEDIVHFYEQAFVRLDSGIDTSLSGPVLVDEAFGQGVSWNIRHHLGGALHAAWDISGPRNTGIYSPLEGVVVFSGRSAGYGKRIKILHPHAPRLGGRSDGPVYTNYCHLDEMLVSTDQTVHPGQAIGLMGNMRFNEVGITTIGTIGTHLHFSVQLAGTTDPAHANPRLSSQYERNQGIDPQDWFEAATGSRRPYDWRVTGTASRDESREVREMGVSGLRRRRRGVLRPAALNIIQPKTVSQSRSHLRQNDQCSIMQQRVMLWSGQDQYEPDYNWITFIDDVALSLVSGLNRGDSLLVCSWDRGRRAIASRIIRGMVGSSDDFLFNNESQLIAEIHNRMELLDTFMQGVNDRALMAGNRAHREIVLSQPQLTETIISDIAFDASQHLISGNTDQLLTEIVERINEFILDPNQSTLDLLPMAGLPRYREFGWNVADFPGGTPGPHEQHARHLHRDLGRVLNERRPHIGPHAIMSESEEVRHRSYIVSELLPVPHEPGDRPGQRLNRLALESFHRMRSAAADDGVNLIIINAFRSRAASISAAASAGNPAAVADFSAHNLGLAIDFRMSSGSQQFAETTTQSMPNLIEMRQSAVHKWLFINGPRYGWYPYHAEPWHWEYNPSGFRDLFFENMSQ